MPADPSSIVSAAATAVYAAVSAISLVLLSRQIGDARRFGAAPALLVLLKEMEEHMAAVRATRGDGGDVEPVVRFLEFFERVEHLREAGVLPTGVLAKAIGPVLTAHLGDPRFRRIIDQDVRQHEEVLSLAHHLDRHR